MVLSIFQKFGPTFSRKTIMVHTAVIPVIIIMGVGVSMAFSFAMYSLFRKPDVDLTRRPRFVDMREDEVRMMVDSRPWSRIPAAYSEISDEHVKLRNEIYEVYYPKK